MLREALRDGSFAVTCEFVPGRGKGGPAVDAAAQFARDLGAAGVTVHAVSITDNPGGNPAISPDVLAAEIRQVGGEPLVHFSCRDRNRNAIESRAMALARMGIQNLLVITGDYPSNGCYEGTSAGVFDLDAVQAVKYLKEMNAGIKVPGKKPGTTASLPATDFLLGVGVSPFKLTEEELMLQFFKLEKKVRAGADFIIPQLGYDMRKFLEIKRYLASRDLNVPVVGNVYVLSYGAAKVMQGGGVPGCVVTDELVAKLKAESAEPDKGKGKRLERAAQMVAMFKGMGFGGVHIGGFGLKSDDFVYIIRHGLELEPQWESFIPEVSFSRPNEFYAFPAPVTYRPTRQEKDPVATLSPGCTSVFFSVWNLLHGLLFDRKALGYRILVAWYRFLEKHKLLGSITHTFEFAVKSVFLGCRDCGDCALPDTAYRCPMYRCAKQQRNGPCGGSRDGMCEVYPTEKPCAWIAIYQRLKGAGRIEELRQAYVPPCRAELRYTSGWANFFLNRDHAAVPAETPAASGAGESAANAGPEPKANIH
ncbi:MAG: hypothetical protein A3K19_25235 [Lentisphaerae bacterium RIFOXYB12_FULL_65_16]|nr:MAG: hypothetical protein A3K18_06640 [Lentisphaerae bacterium RIFOXYA12_64_32]OGV91125.1 MAG: hypothetical protein A3K19_25235 [Lentisphaerae bacterium RIFOXYB12_FULL_65_16]